MQESSVHELLSLQGLEPEAQPPETQSSAPLQNNPSLHVAAEIHGQHESALASIIWYVITTRRFTSSSLVGIVGGVTRVPTARSRSAFASGI